MVSKSTNDRKELTDDLEVDRSRKSNFLFTILLCRFPLILSINIHAIVLVVRVSTLRAGDVAREGAEGIVEDRVSPARLTRLFRVELGSNHTNENIQVGDDGKLVIGEARRIVEGEVSQDVLLKGSKVGCKEDKLGSL